MRRPGEFNEQETSNRLPVALYESLHLESNILLRLIWLTGAWQIALAELTGWSLIGTLP